MGKKKIVIVGGPTASGKSDLAFKIASEFNGEIISADSMQIYKRLDIGTAKPSREEQKLVRHHLIDIAEPWENYSAAEFTRNANAAICDVQSRGKLPVICGGTGLYIESLIHPTDYACETDIDEGLRGELMKKDASSLWKELKEIDPDSAAATHENNKKRVVRALEIYYKTGKTKTQNDKEQKRNESDYDYLLLLTAFDDRQKLYDRINRRVDKMVCEGLVKETESLIKNNDLRRGTTAYQAIGYKEFFPYINGEKTLEECTEKLKQATRNYAKRQITWFSRYDGVKVLTYKDAEDAVIGFLERS